MAPLVRTGGSRHTGLAAPPHRNIHDLICDIKFLLWRIEFQTESKALMQAVNRIEEEKLSVIAVEYIIRTACFDKKNVLLKLCECYIRLNKEDKAFQMLKYGKDINR